jgi:hypothetical protein
METTMHQELDNNTKDATESNNNTKGVNITDLIKYTPNLEEYIKASILTKCSVRSIRWMLCAVPVTFLLLNLQE